MDFYNRIVITPLTFLFKTSNDKLYSEIKKQYNDLNGEHIIIYY